MTFLFYFRAAQFANSGNVAYHRTEMSLAEKIKQKAREAGFDKVGICSADPLEQERQYFQEWLARNYQGTMGYLQKNLDKRADVKKVFPEAQSILACTLNYFKNEQTQPVLKNAKISKYAQGKDYHDVVSGKLTQLLSAIKTLEPKTEGKIYVDTGPLLEKALAVRAGVGWQGKNTNILTDDAGSFFFLGILLLNLSLPSDQPVIDGCRSCMRCLDACPTQAFPETYVLDAAKCIAYLTIEYRGVIEPPLSGKMQDWIFGCDVCQDVCPYNVRDAEPTQEMELAASAELQGKTLLDFFSLSEDEFRKQFRSTPLLRAKWHGFMRNCMIAAANTQNAEAIPLIEKFLRHENNVLSETAKWALHHLRQNTQETACKA